MQGNAKPFVKWVGGKSQLLPQLEMLLPKDLASRENLTYVEPCVGGGAMLYFMLKKFRNIKRVLINDLNERLVTTYKVVRDHPKDLIAALHDIQTEYYACSCESERCDVYFKCLERFNGGILSDLSVAALFIFLNRTCFNGLYRVNSKGQFNVSFGKSVHPLICDEATIFGDSELLQHVEIRCGDFSTVGSCVSAPAFYYIDPPYRPLTKTSAFTGYSEKGFDQECQIRLASFCRELSANGHLLMMSNSDPHNVDANDMFFETTYEGFDITRVHANRMVNSNASRRGKISEIVIRNYH